MVINCLKLVVYCLRNNCKYLIFVMSLYFENMFLCLILFEISLGVFCYIVFYGLIDLKFWLEMKFKFVIELEKNIIYNIGIF